MRWRLQASDLSARTATANRLGTAGATPRSVLVTFNGLDGDFARLGFAELAAADGAVLALGPLFPDAAAPTNPQPLSLARGTPRGSVLALAVSDADGCVRAAPSGALWPAARCADPADDGSMARADPSFAVYSGAGDVVYVPSAEQLSAADTPRLWRFDVSAGAADGTAGFPVPGPAVGMMRVVVDVAGGGAVYVVGRRMREAVAEYVEEDATVMRVVRMRPDLGGADWETEFEFKDTAGAGREYGRRSALAGEVVDGVLVLVAPLAFADEGRTAARLTGGAAGDIVLPLPPPAAFPDLTWRQAPVAVAIDAESGAVDGAVLVPWGTDVGLSEVLWDGGGGVALVPINSGALPEAEYVGSASFAEASGVNKVAVKKTAASLFPELFECFA